MRRLDRAGKRQNLPSAGRLLGVLAWALCSIVGAAPRVLAEPLDGVHYEAFDSCPARAEFVERLRTRMGADGTRVPANVSLQVRLAAHNDGTHGTVEILRGTTRTQRSVDGRRCEEVVEALALIAALALREPEAAPARSGVREADISDAADLPPRAASPAADSGIGAQPPSSDSSEEPSWQLGAHIGAAALLFSGLAPALQPGLQLQAAVTLRSGDFAWSLQLGGRIARTDQLVSPEGDARLGFVGAVVRLCAAHPLGSTPLVLAGCAVAEPGVHSADGENTRNRRSHSRLWLAAGAAADISVGVSSWLGFRAGAELLAPVRRDTVWLAGDTLYRVPALGFRLQLGVEVPFG